MLTESQFSEIFGHKKLRREHVTVVLEASKVADSEYVFVLFDPLTFDNDPKIVLATKWWQLFVSNVTFYKKWIAIDFWIASIEVSFNLHVY